MQSISPETIFRGNYAWEKSLPQITKLTKSPLILGRGIHTNNLRNKIFNDLKNQKLSVHSANLQFDCCYEDISRVKNIISNNNNDSVIAAGGGKVLDSGKYIAESLNIPCITVPLSASTCAGWTALSNIYTKDGQFIKDVALGSCPKILVFDHKFIQTAPSRTLASGIADALAKWYESSITSSKINDGLVQHAIQISRVLRDQLLIDGGKAKIKIPDGTQSGKQFRLKGKGMPFMRRGDYGDLYVQVNTEVPVSLNKEQKELLEKFRKIENERSNPSIKKFFQKAKNFWKN